MEIVAALFIDSIDLRPVPGPSTRIDLTGIQFSAAAPTEVPLTWAPHLVVIVRAVDGAKATGALEVVYRREGDDEQIARNVQLLEVEPGKFTYRLVRAELEFAEYGIVFAECKIDSGPITTVPYTLLPPVEES